VVNVNEDFARLDEHVRPQETIEGAFYLLDSENSGHFGHLMTEVISRLWGWERAKQVNPDLKVIFRVRYVNERNPELEQAVFAAYGIRPDDIVWVDHPVYLQTAYGATPMFHNATPHYVHPQIRAVWRRLREGLDRSGSPRFDRVFLSRRDTLGNRRCLNRAEVEQRFAAEGFEIVYPEDYPMRHQAGMLEHARVVAGFGGSAMFNTLFAEHLEKMIVLNQEGYTARNEHLIALALGVDIHYLWSVPQVQHPEGGWSQEAYKSNWMFDFRRLGTALDELLAGTRA
jgi:capsular polysaccharide biosynthesis protein